MLLEGLGLIGQGIGSGVGMAIQNGQFKKNMAFQREQFEYQKDLNEMQMQREDNAVQRAMQDRLNAGLSANAEGGGTTTALGSTSMSGDTSKITTPTFNATDAISTLANKKFTDAQTRNLNAQADVNEETKEEQIEQKKRENEKLQVEKEQMKEEMENRKKELEQADEELKRKREEKELDEKRYEQEKKKNTEEIKKAEEEIKKMEQEIKNLEEERKNTIDRDYWQNRKDKAEEELMQKQMTKIETEEKLAQIQLEIEDLDRQAKQTTDYYNKKRLLEIKKSKMEIAESLSRIIKNYTQSVGEINEGINKWARPKF